MLFVADMDIYYSCHSTTLPFISVTSMDDLSMDGLLGDEE